MKLEYVIRLIRELARFKDDRCRKPDRSGFFIRQTFFPRATRKEENRAGAGKKVAKINGRTRTIWVRLDKLKSTQSCLSRPRMTYQLRRHPLKHLPVVIKLGHGKFLLWDGNHRATARALLGYSRMKCTELYYS